MICKTRRLLLGLISCRGGRFSASFDVFFVDVPMRLSPRFVFRWDPLWFVFLVSCPMFRGTFRSDLVCCDFVGRLVLLGVVVGVGMLCESPLLLGGGCLAMWHGGLGRCRTCFIRIRSWIGPLVSCTPTLTLVLVGDGVPRTKRGGPHAVAREDVGV